MKLQNLSLKQSGFTLIESLMVILVVGLLIGYLGPKLFFPIEEPKDKVALVQMKSIADALDHFHRDNRRYPTSDEGLGILVEQLANKDSMWKGPYISAPNLHDPWGNPYIYQITRKEKGYALLSLGADGKPEGRGDNADIIY